jgi:hypothetical protein
MHDQPETAKTPENADVSYEGTDASLVPVVAMGIAIVLLGLMTFALCLWMFDLFKQSSARQDPGLAPLAAKERPILPKDLGKIPAPRLEVNESLDMEQFRKAEEAQLNSYGWIDGKGDTVHIPIAEAMRLLAKPEFAKERGIRVEPATEKEGK